MTHSKWSTLSSVTFCCEAQGLIRGSCSCIRFQPGNSHDYNVLGANITLQETTGFTRTWDDYNKGSSASSTPTSGYGAVSKFETADNKGYGIKTGSSCFKCGEEGHWARDCPGTSSNTPTGAREKSSSDGSFTRSWDDYNKGTSTPNSGYGVRTGSSCFKCGEEGHWARDCPTTPSNPPTGVQEKSSSDGCYKCGQSGHWAKDCSQNQVRYH